MKQQITTNDAPKAPGLLSQGIASNGFVFVAGQIHSRPDGTLVEGTTEEKVQQIMSNVEAILTAAQVSLNDVVKVNVYVTDIAELPKLNEIYKTYFAEPLPVREAVCVKALPLGASIEMSVIASAIIQT